MPSRRSPPKNRHLCSCGARPIDEVLDLGGAIDGLPQQQIGMNIDALEVATGRDFTAEERAEITAATLKAWRWTFPVSGLQHPKRRQAGGRDHGRGPQRRSPRR